MSDWKKTAKPVGEWQKSATPVEDVVAMNREDSPLEGIPLEPQEPAPNWLEPKSVTGTIVRGFGKGGSLNFSDEVSGAMGASDELGRRIRTALGSQDASSVPVENSSLSLKDALIARYRREREDSRNELAAGVKAYPKTSFVSDIAGGLASPTPFGKSKALTSMGKGLVAGTLSGIGDSRADMTKGELGETLIDASLGGGGGALLGRLFGGLGNQGGVILKRRAEDNALKSLGVKAGIGDALGSRGYDTVDEARKLGRVALDEKLIPWVGRAESVAQNAAEAQTHRGAMIDNALEESRKAGKPPDFDAMSMRAALTASEGNMLPRAARAAGPARQIVQDIQKLGEQGGDIVDANKMKSQIYDGINWSTESRLKTKLQKDAVRGFREGIEDHVEHTAGPQLADELRTANQRYGQLADIKSLAQEEARRAAGRQDGSLAGSVGTAMLGGVAGGPVAGAAAGAAKYGLSKAGPFLNGFTARAQDALAPRMTGLGVRSGRVAQDLFRQAEQTLRRPQDEKDEDAISAWLNSIL